MNFFAIFLEFSCLGRVWTEFRTKIFFHSFLANLIPFSLKRMPEVVFQFFEFFCNFFRNFLPGSLMNGIQDENFFVSFSAYLILFGLKIMPERGFLIFWIFLLFFSEFSSADQVWTEFGTKIFLSLSPPISSHFRKINTGKRLFNFLNSFAIFLGIFLPGSVMNGIRDEFFFCLFLGQSHPVWARNNARKRFFNFLNFLAIFFRILFHGSSMNGILA